MTFRSEARAAVAIAIALATGCSGSPGTPNGSVVGSGGGPVAAPGHAGRCLRERHGRDRKRRSELRFAENAIAHDRTRLGERQLRIGRQRIDHHDDAENTWLQAAIATARLHRRRFGFAGNRRILGNHLRRTERYWRRSFGRLGASDGRERRRPRRDFRAELGSDRTASRPNSNCRYPKKPANAESRYRPP